MALRSSSKAATHSYSNTKLVRWYCMKQDEMTYKIRIFESFPIVELARLFLVLIFIWLSCYTISNSFDAQLFAWFTIFVIFGVIELRVAPNLLCRLPVVEVWRRIWTALDLAIASVVLFLTWKNIIDSWHDSWGFSPQRTLGMRSLTWGWLLVNKCVKHFVVFWVCTTVWCHKQFIVGERWWLQLRRRCRFIHVSKSIVCTLLPLLALYFEFLVRFAFHMRFFLVHLSSALPSALQHAQILFFALRYWLVWFLFTWSSAHLLFNELKFWMQILYYLW